MCESSQIKVIEPIRYHKSVLKCHTRNNNVSLSEDLRKHNARSVLVPHIQTCDERREGITSMSDKCRLHRCTVSPAPYGQYHCYCCREISVAENWQAVTSRQAYFDSSVILLLPLAYM